MGVEIEKQNSQIIDLLKAPAPSNKLLGLILSLDQGDLDVSDLVSNLIPFDPLQTQKYIEAIHIGEYLIKGVNKDFEDKAEKLMYEKLVGKEAEFCGAIEVWRGEKIEYRSEKFYH